MFVDNSCEKRLLVIIIMQNSMKHYTNSRRN